jgi:hypothetical protein
MQALFDLRNCAHCGQKHDLCYRGEHVSPSDSYWFICPNSGRRVEFTGVQLSTLVSPLGSIECFCAEDTLP